MIKTVNTVGIERTYSDIISPQTTSYSMVKRKFSLRDQEQGKWAHYNVPIQHSTGSPSLSN